MKHMNARLRDLLTDQDLPLRSDEWSSHRVIRNDGSVLVRLFGPATQQQAVDILTEHLPSVTVEKFRDYAVIVRLTGQDLINYSQEG